jgi:hypothetical protein
VRGIAQFLRSYGRRSAKLTARSRSRASSRRRVGLDEAEQRVGFGFEGRAGGPRERGEQREREGRGVPGARDRPGAGDEAVDEKAGLDH